jgi:hypothetical protein
MKNDSPLSSDYSDTEEQNYQIELLKEYIKKDPKVFERMQSDEYLKDYFLKRGTRESETEDKSTKYGRRKVDANLNEEMNNHWSRIVDNNVILFNSMSIDGKAFSPHDIISKNDNIYINDIENMVYISKISIENHTFTACCVIKTKKSKTYIIDPNVMPEVKYDISEAKEERNKLLEMCKEKFLKYTNIWKIDHDIEFIPVVLNNCGNIANNCAMYPLEYIRNVEKKTRNIEEIKDNKEWIEENIIGIVNGTFNKSIENVEGKISVIEVPNTKYIRIDRSVEKSLLEYIQRTKNQMYTKDIAENISNSTVDLSNKNKKFNPEMLETGVIRHLGYEGLYKKEVNKETSPKEESPTKGSGRKR